MILNVDPVAKPRMTRRDKIGGDKMRPIVARYWAFKASVLRQSPAGYTLPDVLRVTFWIPMPKSWSKKKKRLMSGKPNQQVPDIDNYAKGLMDCFGDDSHIYSLHADKYWAFEGVIHIQTT